MEEDTAQAQFYAENGRSDHYRFYDGYDASGGEDVDMLLELAKRSEGDILELMGSTMRAAIPLARAGRRITAVEPHPEMAKVAKKDLSGEPARVRDNIRIVEADAREFELGMQFGFAYFINNSFLLLLNGFDQILALRTIEAHMQDRGRLLLDVFRPDLELAQDFPDPGGRSLGTSESRVVRFYSYRYDLEAKRVHLTRHYDVFQGVDQWRIEVPFELRYMEHHDFLELFDSSGFELLDVYGDYEMRPLKYDSPRLIYLLEKKGGG